MSVKLAMNLVNLALKRLLIVWNVLLDSLLKMRIMKKVSACQYLSVVTANAVLAVLTVALINPAINALTTTSYSRMVLNLLFA